MEHASFLPFLLIVAPACAQPILITGFESNGAFDLTGVSTYCSLAAIQGSNDTPGGGSVWSAAIPATFSNTCIQPAITQGLFFALPGLSPGQHVGVSFRHKVPVTGALSMNILYVDPASGTLPASESDLGFPEIGFYDPGAGPWNIFTGSFDVPTIIPWPSDLYLVVRYIPGQGSTDPALIDNVEMTPEITAGLNMSDRATSGMRIAPMPAQDRITVIGLGMDDQHINVFNCAGVRVTSVVASIGDGTFDIGRLAPGLYVLRQGPWSARFIKE